MSIEAPVILDEQEPVIGWVRGLRERDISTSTIIEFLVSNKKTRAKVIKEGLDTVREIYNGKNNGWRLQLLTAIVLDSYRKANDIKGGQIVTDGDEVGFAFELDYKERCFDLYARNHKEDYMGTYNMDDFKKV